MGSETKMVRLGEYIRVVSCANEKGLKLPFMGVDKSKKIVPTSANIDGLNPEKYQIIILASNSAEHKIRRLNTLILCSYGKRKTFSKVQVIGGA